MSDLTGVCVSITKHKLIINVFGTDRLILHSFLMTGSSNITCLIFSSLFNFRFLSFHSNIALFYFTFICYYYLNFLLLFTISHSMQLQKLWQYQCIEYFILTKNSEIENWRKRAFLWAKQIWPCVSSCRKWGFSFVWVSVCCTSLAVHSSFVQSFPTTQPEHATSTLQQVCQQLDVLHWQWGSQLLSPI